jgi:hypothetical protein
LADATFMPSHRPHHALLKAATQDPGRGVDLLLLISHAEGRGRWPTVSHRLPLDTEAVGGEVAAGQVVCAC